MEMKSQDSSTAIGPKVALKRNIEDVYRDYAPAAFRLAYLLTGNRETAGDLVQESFTRALSRFIHLRDNEAIEAYLLRTVTNRANSYFRRRAVERRFVQQHLEVGTPQPLDRVEQRHDLLVALQKLPWRQRAALILRYFEDLTEEQSARVLETTPKAVNSLVAHALKNLREKEGDHA